MTLFANERGKGDHKHIGEVGSPYPYEDPEKLIEDFKAAMGAAFPAPA